MNTDKVLVDNYTGAFQAVEYLIKSGCRKIAHLGGPLNLSITQYRLQGYLDALENMRIPIRKEYIVHVHGFSHGHGLEPTKRLLRLEEMPDAIFAMNDSIAISAMQVAKRQALRVPEDISIIGFDDDPNSSYVSPSLTTVWQPVYSLGMLSARIILQRLDDEKVQNGFREEVFKPELVIRASSKKCLVETPDKVKIV